MTAVTQRHEHGKALNLIVLRIFFSKIQFAISLTTAMPAHRRGGPRPVPVTSDDMHNGV